MSKKIRLIRTMIVEYTPDPEYYPEGFSIEQMAELDSKSDDLDLLFENVIEDKASFEIIED